MDGIAPVSRRKLKKKVRSNFVHLKEVADAKQIRRQYERQFTKTKSEIEKQLLRFQINHVRSLALTHRAQVVKGKLSSGDPKDSGSGISNALWLSSPQRL